MFGLLERWIFVRDRSTAAIRYFLLAAAVLLVALPTSAAAASGPQVSIGTVHADFYPNPSNSGSFDTSQLSSKVFSQDFPVIDFNPPASAQVTCSNSTGVDVNSRPFTDVVPDLDGTCSTVPAEAPLLQAGVGVLFTFEAVFSANLTIDAPGQVTFNFFSDDGWMLGAGQQVNGNAQPTYVSGALIGAPTSCIGQTCGTLPSPVHNYVVVGAYNQPSAPTQQQVTINFPNAGTYPIEVDYTECCGGQLALTLGTTAGNPIPPSLQFVGVATGRVVEGVAGAPTSAPTTGYRVSSTTYPLVASFTDLTPGGPPDATRYSATIDWGDGQKGAGIVTPTNSADCTYLGNPLLGVPPSGQCFAVNASHSYSNAGDYKVGVQIAKNGVTGSLSTVGVAEIVPSSSAGVSGDVIRRSTGIVTFDGINSCTAEALANISVIVTAHHCYGSQQWTTAKFTLPPPGGIGHAWCGQRPADVYFHEAVSSPISGDGPVFIVVRPCAGQSGSLQTATGGGLPITFNPPRGLRWLVAAYNARVPPPGFALQLCAVTDMSQSVLPLPEANGVLFGGSCPNLSSGASGGPWLDIHELPGILGIGGTNQGTLGPSGQQDGLYLGDTAMQEYIAAALGLPKP